VYWLANVVSKLNSLSVKQGHLPFAVNYEQSSSLSALKKKKKHAYIMQSATQYFEMSILGEFFHLHMGMNGV
jgi:hypothetical protein